jgi:hypothetical protein
MRETREIELLYNSTKEWYRIPSLVLPNVSHYTLKAINIVSYLYSMLLDHDVEIEVQVENPTAFPPDKLIFPAGTSSVNAIKNIISSHIQFIPDERAIFTLNPLNLQQYKANFETTITYAVKDLKHVQFDLWFIKTALGLNNPLMPQELMVGDLVQWTLLQNQMLKFLPSSMEPTWEIQSGWESTTFNLVGFSESDASAIPTRATKVVELVNNITQVNLNYTSIPPNGTLDLGVVKFIIKDKSSKLKYFPEKDLNVTLVFEIEYNSSSE